MPRLYVVLSKAGPNRDLSLDTREQAHWNDHAAFIDDLVADGFIKLGGPLTDDGGAMIVVGAETETEVRTTLESDPWYLHGILIQECIRRWEIYIDELH